jgi:hypothetical protein
MLSAVLIRSRQIAALLLILVLATGNAALCAGWMATPEARMACCSESGACPMHAADRHSSSDSPVTQAEADRCCAASETDDAAPSAPVLVLSISLAVEQSPVPFAAPAATLRPIRWRSTAPALASRLPRHLLLSVFLV